MVAKGYWSVKLIKDVVASSELRRSCAPARSSRRNLVDDRADENVGHDLAHPAAPGVGAGVLQRLDVTPSVRKSMGEPARAEMHSYSDPLLLGGEEVVVTVEAELPGAFSARTIYGLARRSATRKRRFSTLSNFLTRKLCRFAAIADGVERKKWAVRADCDSRALRQER